MPDTVLPEFDLHDEWSFDPDFLTVNHGSYGAVPRAVLDAQDAWRRRMEAQPTRFMMRELPGALRAAAARLAAFVGAASEDLAFVENATAGCNAVLRSLRFGPGDEIVVLDHGYGAVVKAVRYVAEREGCRVVEAAVPFPRPAEAAAVASVAACLGPRTRLAVLDHITSASALLLPIRAMTDACRAAGVPVLVDGAHGPGNVTLDIPLVGADWYVGNCHKWLMAPRGCGFLWARPGRQDGLHPVTISHGYGQGFLAEFDWTGTRDMSAYLAVTAAIDFHQRLGGPHLRARNARLAADAADRLARRFGTETGAVRSAAHAMALVRMPLPGPIAQAEADRLRLRLLDAGTDAPVNAIGGAAWLRVSAQAYNQISDFDRLFDTVSVALQ